MNCEAGRQATGCEVCLGLQAMGRGPLLAKPLSTTFIVTPFEGRRQLTFLKCCATIVPLVKSALSTKVAHIAKAETKSLLLYSSPLQD